MPDFALSPGLIAIAVVVLLLIIIAVAPENLANSIGQLFQLLGRLIGALAGEAEAGANTLFGVVRGVFNPRPRSQEPTTQTTEKPSQSPVPTQTSVSQPAGQAPQAQAQAPAPQATASRPPAEEEIPLTWVAETIFVRLLYLATVIVIVASDFVFAILRLQAVLFPTLAAPISDLSFLSLLTGALFVAIVLLTGALTLDFLDVLPRPARLFPTLSDRMRKLLLFVSLLSFMLSLVVVGALFLQGQLLISLAETAPVGAIALAAVLGVLQVLVVFLGAWGAIRGLAIILALLGGVIGIVLHLVAVVLQWIGDALDVIGTSIIPELIYGIAAIFGHRRERTPRPAPLSNVLTIVGFGDRSSSFTALLCKDIVAMYGRAGLLAAGAYSHEPAVRQDVQARLGRLGINNISPLAANDTTPMVTLKNHVVRAYQGKGASNKLVLWIVDGEQCGQCTGTLASLKHEMPDLSITVLCLLPPGGIRGAEPFTQLRKLATEKHGRNEAAVSTTILVDDRSPLYRILGEPYADQLVARSLSGMLLAPLHNPANPSFVNVVRNLNEAGQAFAALAVDSGGVVTAQPAGSKPGPNRVSGSGSVSPDMALGRTEDLAHNLLTGSSATTVQQPPDRLQPALYLNFIVPITAHTPEALQFRGLISNWLADEHSIFLYGVVAGQGIDLSEKYPLSKGDRYVQVGVLYGVGADVAQQGPPTSQERVVEAE